MENKCIAPGHWEIENFTVMRDETTGEWWIHNSSDKPPLASVKTLEEAREWIAADLDSIDLGMSTGEEN